MEENRFLTEVANIRLDTNLRIHVNLISHVKTLKIHFGTSRRSLLFSKGYSLVPTLTPTW